VRAVAQRVQWARVRVGDELVAEMSAGLLALVGVAHEDTEADADALAEKLVHLRVFEDEQGKMNRSLAETGLALGVVSQFTLLGDCRKGRRPSWDAAAAPERAEPLIERLVRHARTLGVTVVTGRFRATMEVELCNQGPVTLLLDTSRLF
jgi:D-tyrosyl-tRNA(Tyr) deacylase